MFNSLKIACLILLIRALRLVGLHGWAAGLDKRCQRLG
jgi:hypothetical protein